MGALASLSFGAPLVLAALLALPVIWWLLRVTPPAPRRMRFFGLRFLLGMKTEEETPDKTPLWLLLLRLAAAALIVLALAEPVLNAMRTLKSGDDVLVLVVDDDWAAAHRWDDRRAEMRDAIDEARRADTPVIVAPTTAADFDIKIDDPSDALARAMALEPQPLKADRTAMLAKLQNAVAGRSARVIWLSDGIGGPEASAFIDGLQKLGEVDLFNEPPELAAIGIEPPAQDAQGLTVPLVRADAGAAASGTVQAYGENGRFIANGTFNFAAGETTATARIETPTALRNDIERLVIDNRASAGAVTLIDESQRRRPVGIVTGDDAGAGQPLLSQTYYLERALENAAEARIGTIGSHLQSGVSMIVLADVGQVAGAEHDQLAAWVNKGGGVLVRFAGPRLAASHDDLMPVQLRDNGTRALGGALSWEKPQGLGAFPKDSPFAGLTVPDDIQVSRQVMAEPSLELEGRTWASLTDGTPLVTAQKRGDGWIVLFHVTANAEWSNLPLTGLFVDMLKRMIALGRGVGPADGAQQAAAGGTLNPRLVLDGFGRLVKPTPSVTPIPRSGAQASAEHPPGLYGEGQATVAVNLIEANTKLEPLPELPPGAAAQLYGKRSQVDLKPYLLGAALLLLFIDAIASLLLRGYRIGIRRPAAATAAAALLALLIAAAPQPARAQDVPPPPPPSTGNAQDDFALAAVLQTHLAYIKTGEADLDKTTLEGLQGLTRVLNQRTAVAAADPIGIDPETDEMAFFPLIYWSIPDDGAMPSDQAIAKIDAYMKNGGTVLFDTRDGAEGGPASAALQALLKRLDLPPLQRVPREHVLTKAFYLLNEFPGRQAGGDVWVEAQQSGDGAISEAQGDGVSSVVIGAGDWAAAWAADEYMRPLYAMGPGGERQREYAYRFGVNIVMYALTGNYKADQVHVPALLERMGQ